MRLLRAKKKALPETVPELMEMIVDPKVDPKKLKKDHIEIAKRIADIFRKALNLDVANDWDNIVKVLERSEIVEEALLPEEKYAYALMVMNNIGLFKDPGYRSEATMMFKGLKKSREPSIKTKAMIAFARIKKETLPSVRATLEDPANAETCYLPYLETLSGYNKLELPHLNAEPREITKSHECIVVSDRYSEKLQAKRLYEETLISKSFPPSLYNFYIKIRYASNKADIPEFLRNEAIALLKKAAEAGFAPAQREYAFYFMQKGSTDEAVLWAKRAACQGDFPVFCAMDEKLSSDIMLIKEKAYFSQILKFYEPYRDVNLGARYETLLAYFGLGDIYNRALKREINNTQPTGLRRSYHTLRGLKKEALDYRRIDTLMKLRKASRHYLLNFLIYSDAGKAAEKSHLKAKYNAAKRILENEYNIPGIPLLRLLKDCESFKGTDDSLVGIKRALLVVASAFTFSTESSLCGKYEIPSDVPSALEPKFHEKLKSKLKLTLDRFIDDGIITEEIYHMLVNIVNDSKTSGPSRTVDKTASKGKVEETSDVFDAKASSSSVGKKAAVEKTPYIPVDSLVLPTLSKLDTGKRPVVEALSIGFKTLPSDIEFIYPLIVEFRKTCKKEIAKRISILYSKCCAASEAKYWHSVFQIMTWLEKKYGSERRRASIDRIMDGVMKKHGKEKGGRVSLATPVSAATRSSASTTVEPGGSKAASSSSKILSKKALEKIQATQVLETLSEKRANLFHSHTAAQMFLEGDGLKKGDEAGKLILERVASTRYTSSTKIDDRAIIAEALRKLCMLRKIEYERSKHTEKEKLPFYTMLIGQLDAAFKINTADNKTLHEMYRLTSLIGELLKKLKRVKEYCHNCLPKLEGYSSLLVHRRYPPFLLQRYRDFEKLSGKLHLTEIEKPLNNLLNVSANLGYSPSQKLRGMKTKDFEMLERMALQAELEDLLEVAIFLFRGTSLHHDFAINAFMTILSVYDNNSEKYDVSNAYLANYYLGVLLAQSGKVKQACSYLWKNVFNQNLLKVKEIKMPGSETEEVYTKSLTGLMEYIFPSLPGIYVIICKYCTAYIETPKNRPPGFTPLLLALAGETECEQQLTILNRYCLKHYDFLRTKSFLYGFVDSPLFKLINLLRKDLYQEYVCKNIGKSLPSLELVGLLKSVVIGSTGGLKTDKKLGSPKHTDSPDGEASTSRRPDSEEDAKSKMRASSTASVAVAAESSTPAKKDEDLETWVRIECTF